MEDTFKDINIMMNYATAQEHVIEIDYSIGKIGKFLEHYIINSHITIYQN